MSHQAFLDGEALVEEADVVVVGSGAGGATAALLLARAGIDVAIVEAGAKRDPEDYPHSTWGAMRDLFDDFGSLITKGRALWPIVQARTVGGTTVINSAICVRTPADIFAQWEKEFGLDAAALERRVGEHQDRIEAELSVRTVSERARGESNRLAMVGSDKGGFDGHWIERYERGCEGKGQCLQGCRDDRKQSTNVTYIPEALRLGARLFSCAPVRRIRFRNARATGVEGYFIHPQTKKRGASFFIRAKRAVIVAASATHSPALLLRSGVKHPALGELFRAHPGTGVFGLYDEPVDMNSGTTQGWASTHFRDDPGLKLETLAIPFEMVASRLSGGGNELMRRIGEYRHMCMWVHAVRAESRGRVRNGLFGRPSVHYELNRPDMERMRAGIRKTAELHFAAGAKKIVCGVHGMPYALSADEIGKLDDLPLDPRAYVAILSHLFGGCPMGDDPQSSFCDASGRVHGYDGLIVADASVIPTNLGVNPQHTIMALAGVFAEDLIKTSFP